MPGNENTSKNRISLKGMTLEEFITHKTSWANGFSEHMKLSNIDFETYMRMNGLGKEEFAILNNKSNEKIS